MKGSLGAFKVLRSTLLREYLPEFMGKEKPMFANITKTKIEKMIKVGFGVLVENILSQFIMKEQSIILIFTNQ